MKEYPVGSICVLIASDIYPNLIGAETTILGPLREHLCKNLNTGKRYRVEGYIVDLPLPNQPAGNRTVTSHKSLRLKKFPPEQDAWCREVMKTVLKPVSLPCTEGDPVQWTEVKEVTDKGDW